jgi:hypothetical protein
MTTYRSLDTIGSNVDLSSAQKANLGKPQVAMDDQGNAIAAWWEKRGDNWYLMANRFGPPVVIPCSEEGIRGAIAVGGGPYHLDCSGLPPITTGSQIVIDKDVILSARGNVTVDGNNTHRVFSVTEGTTAELRGFTVTGGAAEDGGGILNEGTLKLINSTITGNTASRYGGGIATLAIDAVLTVVNSTISANEGNGAGVFGGDGELSFTGSTISGNLGSGIYSLGADVRVTNSTISGNTGAGLSLAVFLDVPNLYLTNTTLSGNGAEAISFISDGELKIASSIIDGSCSFLNPPDATFTLESPGTTCSLPVGNNNLMGLHPLDQLKLGDLQDNGGRTLTHAPQVDSLAIDFIPQAACVDQDDAPLTRDQRGVRRPDDTTCDVGAVEVQ